MQALRFSNHPIGIGISLAVFALGIGLPLMWDLPGHWRLIGALQNSGHAVLFFAMAWCLAWRNIHAYAVLIGLCVLGVGIEGVQYFIGKDCDIHDVLLDNLGAVSGVLAFKAYARRTLNLAIVPLGLMAVAFYIPCFIALCYLQQWRNFPTLVTFDEVGRNYLIDHHEGSEYALTTLPGEFTQQAAPANRTQVLKLRCPAQNWPGVALIDLAPNWLGFNFLQMDVWLADKTPIQLGLALRGLHNQSDHHDVSQHFPLQPGYNRVRWPLKDIAGAATDANLLTSIDKIIIFCMPEHTRMGDSELYLGAIKLLD